MNEIVPNNEQLEETIKQNMGLVYHIMKRFNINKFSSKYDESFSNASFGLVKAALTYDPSRNNTFSTYAAKCISNEILYGMRKKKKYDKNEIYIYEENYEDSDGEKLLLIDTISEEANFMKEIMKKQELISLISISLNCLKGVERWCFLKKISGVSQRKIAEELGITQSMVSRIQRRAIRKVRTIYFKNFHYKEIFKIEIVDYKYSLSFNEVNIVLNDLTFLADIIGKTDNY